MSYTEFDSEKLERFFKGMYSDKDASYVNEVFADKRKEKELIDFLSRQFDNLTADNNEEKKKLDHILYKIHYNINTRKQEQNERFGGNILKWSLRIAAVVLLPLIVFFAVQKFNASDNGNQAWTEINSPAWTRVQFSLPDGTTGWLNSSSSIRYNSDFKKDRQVTLKGEAFFNVFKDKKSPFIVTAKEVKVKVLGTKFNIASYDNEKNVEVVLEEGSLLFTETKQNKSYTMFPNDLILYDKAKEDFTKDIVQPQKYLSWTEGKLVFRNDPLDVLARRLARWYNVDVEVKIDLTDDLRLRATFIDEGLEEVLSLLKRSMPVDYKIEDREINSDGTYGRRKVILTARAK
jgi:ferric-dicitrate binding protein FerR (iron transport regulator)